jgi:ABC-type glycerol-3-phosphate transport system permease component
MGLTVATRDVIDRASRQGKRRRRFAPIVLHLSLVILLVLSIYPVIMMLVLSFKNPVQWLNERWTVSFPLRVQNYATAWNNVIHYVLNTVLVAVVGSAGMLILASLSAFVFARMRFPGREVLYYSVIALLMIPSVLSLVPAFVLYKTLGMYNTYWALIVPIITGGAVFGVFLLRTFFASLPEELFEAARIDGAGVMVQFWRLCIPLSYPILGTLAILQIVYTWNDFIWPSVVIQDDSRQMISVGLVRLTNTMTNTATGDSSAVYGPLFAAYVLAAVPIFLLFVFAGKYYVEGLVSSGLKL